MHNPNGKFHLPKGSLYTPFPVPAYQVLGNAKQFNAQKVLMALVSHMGKNDNAVFPSYSTIMKEAGMGRNSVSQGLKVLREYEFIKSVKIPMGIQARNKYFIQFACWDSSRMNEIALPERTYVARFLACMKMLQRSDYAISPLGKVHWGCGGFVYPLRNRKKGRN
jgi:hypothetical protein